MAGMSAATGTRRRLWLRTVVAVPAVTVLFTAFVAPFGATQAHAAQSQVQRPGPKNSITDVAGIRVGQYARTDKPYLTGTTVVYAPDGAFGGVDVAGGAPGTRETDELDPRDEVENINAVTLSGGSAYGLAAADGVMRYLEQHNQGFPVGSQPGEVVPLVPSAIIYDLGRGGSFTARPDTGFGYRAISNNTSGRVGQGVVGAGAGAVAGGFKSGVGTASVELGNGIVVGALMVDNSVGSAVNPENCGFYARYLELGHEFGRLRLPSAAECSAWRAGTASTRGAGSAQSGSSMNTTIGVVATNATLTKAQAWKMAQVAQDGEARAISPVHTLFDGDTIFAMSTAKLGLNCTTAGCSPDATHRLIDCQLQTTGQPAAAGACDATLSEIYTAAANAVSRAIVHAHLAARSVDGFRSYGDTFPSACSAGVQANGVAWSTGGKPTTNRPLTPRQAVSTGAASPLGQAPLWSLIGAAVLLCVAGYGAAGRIRSARRRAVREAPH